QRTLVDSLPLHDALPISEEMGRLTWGLGAMAAERVFYGENSTGVGGDVMTSTARAAWMVGACAMGPEPIEVNGSGFRFNGRPRQIGRHTSELQSPDHLVC